MAVDCISAWKSTEASTSYPLECSWQRPAEDFDKLDVDGISSLGDPGRAGFGGLIRTSAGSFVVGLIY
jgi:hypothetical protein